VKPKNNNDNNNNNFIYFTLQNEIKNSRKTFTTILSIQYFTWLVVFVSLPFFSLTIFKIWINSKSNNLKNLKVPKKEVKGEWQNRKTLQETLNSVNSSFAFLLSQFL